MMSWLRLRAVSTTEVTIAWALAPASERKPPLTLRWMTELRSARSEALLS